MDAHFLKKFMKNSPKLYGETCLWDTHFSISGKKPGGKLINICIFVITRSLQGLYNWAACDVTNPILSPLLSLTFQVISGTPQIFRLLNPRGKKRYHATQYVNFSVTLLRYGLKILTDSWIEGDSLGYPDHPPRRCHPECQPTFIHFFTNTLKCLHGRLAG